MSLRLHTIKPAKGATKKRKRVGRGNASGHGTYSTRGLKGQRSRSGGKSGLKLRGFRANLQNAPKLRGFNSPKPAKAELKLSDIQTHFNDGDVVSPETVKEKKIIKSSKSGIKVLGNGNLTKKVTIKGCYISASAAEKVQAAGGKVEPIK